VSFNYTPGARGFTTGDTERRAVLDRDADAGLAGAGFEAEGCAACRVKEPRVLEVEVANASWRVKSLHFSRRVYKDSELTVYSNIDWRPEHKLQVPPKELCITIPDMYVSTQSHGRAYVAVNILKPGVYMH
jgi:hypothetical protein